MNPKIFEDVRAELTAAQARYPRFRSYDEGVGVIDEEVFELWQEVMAKHGKRSASKMRKEAVQVAAMAWRFCIDIGGVHPQPERFPDPIWEDQFPSPAAGITVIKRHMRKLDDDPESAASCDILIAAIKFIRDCCSEESSQL